MARITIEDVASEAGVSVTTVSHVFSGNRPVSTDTQILVREIAARLGYHPNAIAQSLRSQRTHTIMIVVPDITNTFYPDYARSLQDVAAAAGFHSLLCNTDAREAEERAYLDEALSRRLDGVVFTGFRVTPPDLEALVDAGIAAVWIGPVPPASPLDAVRFDDRAAAAEATRFVIDRYGPRIALIYGDEESTVGRERRLGFEAACRDAGIARDHVAVVLEEFNRAGGHRGMRRLLALPEPPRAVVCANDMIALGAIEVAREAGLRIPNDIAIVGYDDVDVATVVTPRLTTVRTNARRLGSEAGQLLVSRMTGKYSGPGRHVTIPHELVVRESA